MLREAKWRKQDTDGYLDGTEKMCALYLKAGEIDSAWQCFGEFANVAGEKKFPAKTWYDLAQGLEQQGKHDEALDQYTAIAKSFSNEKISVQSQIAAAKLCLNKLNRAAEAVQWYEAAANSQVTHSELDSAIQVGLSAARKAAGQPESLKVAAAFSALPMRSFGVASGKPLTWGELDAPPVWGHGANGDTIHKPDFSHELTVAAKK